MSTGGEELLIVDGDQRALAGMNQLFVNEGYLVTPLDDGARATHLAGTKFFPVVLIDFQIPNRSGLDVLSDFRKISPQTKIIFISREPTADQVAEAFRRGAFDVIKKDRTQVEYLKGKVRTACGAYRDTSGSSQLLLKEVKQILEELVTTLMEYAKRNLLLEGSESIMAAGRMSILLADSGQDLFRLLSTKQSLNITHCHSGGEALDQMTQHKFDLLIVQNNLPDLPSAMLLKQGQGHSSETLGYRIDAFNGAQGKFTPFLKGKESGPAEQFMNPLLFLKKLEELHERKGEVARERRAVESVTRRNYHLFKRYGEVRDRLGTAIDASER
jgi:DNA-binding NtrC family response regulator